MVDTASCGWSNAQLLGIGQHQPVRQRFQQLPQPLVAPSTTAWNAPSCWKNARMLSMCLHAKCLRTIPSRAWFTTQRTISFLGRLMPTYNMVLLLVWKPKVETTTLRFTTFCRQTVKQKLGDSPAPP